VETSFNKILLKKKHNLSDTGALGGRRQENGAERTYLELCTTLWRCGIKLKLRRKILKDYKTYTVQAEEKIADWCISMTEKE
jgi:hypothetical protein